MKRASPIFFALAVAWGFAGTLDAEEKPLPPAAGGRIDFARDIGPIFQNSCLRCHGPEKPKSHFRLDNRASALAGGEKNTNDIVPGNSAGSLLIHYVAGAVEDMEMPPEGKGEPLTPKQIGLLRAWIDQGARWSTNGGPATSLVVAPVAGGIGVQGNKGKFRELEETTDGVSGGLEKFSYAEQFGPNEKLTIDGHVLAPQQDISVNLALEKTDVGFVRAGFDHWRKYYGDDGGFDPTVTPAGFATDGNLYLDNGRAWVDLGLSLPHGPQLAIGYEYDYRDGTESTLDWGYANGKNIFPATQAVDERTHILKFDATNDWSGWHVEDSARAEFYTEKNLDAEGEIFSGGATPDEVINTRDDYHHVQGMNTLTFEKAVRDGWLVTGGFCYSRLEGSDYFNQSFNGNSVLSSQQITLGRDSEIFSATSLFTPAPYLTFSLGTQNEWTRENGFGASVPDLELGVNSPADSSLEEFKATQQANFRFTKIPFTVVSGAAQLEEESVSEYQMEDPDEFMRDTAAENHLYNFNAGFNTSPWRTFEWSGQFRRQDSTTDYGQLLDIYKYFGLNSPTNGYPAFILNRDIRSDVLESKLVWRPAHWLKTTLTYQITSTDYSSKTDPFIYNLGQMEILSAGGPILDGTYDAQNYGFGVTVTPVRRLYFSGAFTYSLSRAITADNGDPSVVPYRGNIYSLNAAATYALGLKSTVQAAYNFSRADYAENNAAAGLPLGLDYTRHDLSVSLTRKFSARLAGSLRYAFSQYTEPSSGNGNNYLANGVFCALTYKCP
ncbi:MAG TPA: c-type cytochrome domain-containing protein [Verrucomicrobiae bacterium]|nr:c-type cytochrome domain-containing protein [Verrucomicrobiae bacterium]